MCSPTQVCRDFPEPFESGFEIFDDLLVENVRIGRIVGFFEAFVAEPENIEAGFVAVDEFLLNLGPSKRFASPFLLPRHKRLKHRGVRTRAPQLATLRLAAIRMKHDPPKRAAKPAANHIALVIRGHVQCSFEFKVKAEMMQGKISRHRVCLRSYRLVHFS